MFNQDTFCSIPYNQAKLLQQHLTTNKFDLSTKDHHLRDLSIKMDALAGANLLFYLVQVLQNPLGN